MNCTKKGIAYELTLSGQEVSGLMCALNCVLQDDTVKNTHSGDLLELWASLSIRTNLPK